MTVEIIDVKRINGMVVEVTAQIGEIEVCYLRTKDNNLHEVSCVRYGAQILDKDTLYINKADYQILQKKIGKILKEIRPNKKSKKEFQGKLFSEHDFELLKK